MFYYDVQSLTTHALELQYHLAPWDIPILGANVATISSIQVHMEVAAGHHFAAFRDWCHRERVVLVNSRLPQDQLRECSFLEARGFRFIELNYLPRLEGLGRLSLDDSGDEIKVVRAGPEDETFIAGVAGQIFTAGRFHADPLLGPEIGNRRYRTWAANAFHHPRQIVLKCQIGGQLAAFMVVEQSEPESRFWSLVGIVPGFAGRRLGRRIWQAVLKFHREEGVTTVSTSISSHNIPAHNLYVSLGFRFPRPYITLHWCPFGRNLSLGGRSRE
jgi:GNAT superfamily N-acetyltransferase